MALSIYGISPLLHLGTFVVVIVLLLDFQLPMQSVHITINVVSSNLVRGEVYSIQHV